MSLLPVSRLHVGRTRYRPTANNNPRSIDTSSTSVQRAVEIPPPPTSDGSRVQYRTPLKTDSDRLTVPPSPSDSLSLHRTPNTVTRNLVVQTSVSKTFVCAVASPAAPTIHECVRVTRMRSRHGCQRPAGPDRKPITSAQHEPSPQVRVASNISCDRTFQDTHTCVPAPTVQSISLEKKESTP